MAVTRKPARIAREIPSPVPVPGRLSSFLSLLIVLFILIPLAKVVLLSDKESLWQALTDSTTINSIALTLYAALITTAIGFILGVPLAYILARYDFPGKSAVEGLIDLPIVVPHTAAGIALLFVFGRNFLVGKWFNAIGISSVDSLAGIVIAMLFVSVPFLINSAKEGFKKVDVRLEKVSRTLGGFAVAGLSAYHLSAGLAQHRWPAA